MAQTALMLGECPCKANSINSDPGHRLCDTDSTKKLLPNQSVHSDLANVFMTPVFKDLHKIYRLPQHELFPVKS